MRVADVIRRDAERVPTRSRCATASGSSSTESSTSARTGSRRRCSRRRERRRARRVPRPHVSRGRRAAVRGEQDRRGARAAELAAGAVRAGRGRGRRAGAGVDRRPRVPRGRRHVLERLSAGARAGGRVGEAYEGWLAAHDAARSGRARRGRRHRRPDVHLRHDRRPEGRADHAAQPRRDRRDLAPLGVRRAIGQPHAPADVPHRRDRLGVLSGCWHGATTILVREFDAHGRARLLEHRR